MVPTGSPIATQFAHCTSHKHTITTKIKTENTTKTQHYTLTAQKKSKQSTNYLPNLLKLQKNWHFSIPTGCIWSNTHELKQRNQIKK